MQDAWWGLSTSSACAVMPLQARSVSSDGLSRHGSGSMPEAGSHGQHHGSQLQTAASSSTQAASVDGELFAAVPCTGSGLALVCRQQVSQPVENGNCQCCACRAVRLFRTQKLDPVDRMAALTSVVDHNGSCGAGAGGRVSMQLVLKDALERAASGASSSLGDAPPSKPRSSLDDLRRPRSSSEGGSILGRAGER
jgi:hypothetical protein